MKTQIALSLLLSITPVFTSAKNMNDLLSPYSAATWKSPTGGAFLYRHASPAKMEKGKKYPLLVFFHGAGGRGNDNKGQLVDAGGMEPLTRQVCKPEEFALLCGPSSKRRALGQRSLGIARA